MPCSGFAARCRRRECLRRRCLLQMPAPANACAKKSVAAGEGRFCCFGGAHRRAVPHGCADARCWSSLTCSHGHRRGKGHFSSLRGMRVPGMFPSTGTNPGMVFSQPAGGSALFTAFSACFLGFGEGGDGCSKGGWRRVACCEASASPSHGAGGQVWSLQLVLFVQRQGT